MKKIFAMFFVFGLIGMLIEVTFNAICKLSFSLIGSTSVWMLFVYGFAGVVLDLLNENRFVNKWFNAFWQTVAGTCIVYAVEFCSGCALNLGLGLGIWDYKALGLDVMGQITFWYAPLWFLLCPFAFWMGDCMRVWEMDPMPVLRNYYLALRKPFRYTNPKIGDI